MEISFASTRRKIALFFSISSSFFILLATLVIIFFVKLQMDNQARKILTRGLETLVEDFEAERLQEKSVSYQTASKLKEEYELSEKLPNIKSFDEQHYEAREEKQVEQHHEAKKEKKVVDEIQEADFKQLEASKEMFSRVILSNGDILFTSDIFDNYYINPQKFGFYKKDFNGVCIYSYTSKVVSGENAGAIVQTAQYCPFTPKQERNLYILMLFACVVVSTTTYIGGLVVADWFLKPLQKSVLQTKEFAQNVYHELLTPTTVAMTTAAAAISSGNYKKGLFSVKKDLKDIYKSLDLLSSQAFCDQAKISLKEVNLSQSLLQNLEQCLKKHRRKDLNINTSGVKKSVVKLANPTSLKLIFQNLIDNTLKYAMINSSIVISLDAKIFFIENKAKNLKNINIKRFFKRFYRDDFGIKAEGRGLGLSLVKELVDAHNWKVKAEKIAGKIRITILF